MIFYLKVTDTATWETLVYLNPAKFHMYNIKVFVQRVNMQMIFFHHWSTLESIEII